MMTLPLTPGDYVFSPVIMSYKSDVGQPLKFWELDFQLVPVCAIKFKCEGGRPTVEEFLSVLSGMHSVSSYLVGVLWVVLQSEYLKTLADALMQVKGELMNLD